MTVVTILKLDDRSPDFLQVPEDATVNGLFLQRPVEALSDAIRLRFGRRIGELVMENELLRKERQARHPLVNRRSSK